MPLPDASQSPLRIGVDVGGTFTDLVATDGRALTVVKVLSTPDAFHRGVLDAIGKLSQDSGLSARDAALVHGSTVATNALLQRAGERVALITTEGFADILLIGRQNRPELYALDVRRPAPITQDCFGVTERIDAAGQIVTPLDESSVRKVIEQVQARGISHVAICLLFGFANPVHERRVADLCRAAGLTVSLSSDLLPEFREYERASTTAINAALRPTVETYLKALEAGLRSGPGTPDSGLSILHSSGGTLAPGRAAEHAVRLVLSGPAGGVLGAAHVAALAGYRDVITYDMGGTSTDVAIVLDGRPQWTTSTTIDGLPIALPMFDIHTVGAGGGSVAYRDAGGALRVGPRSAGAEPGPACYGRGGVEPTVTDADLLLGRIPHAALLGGSFPLRHDLAESAIAALAAQLNLTVTQTALGISAVAESNMAAALRAVSSRRGHDSRQFTLVSFGGAGGLHACAIAEALDIPRVLIPPCAGVLSALGMVVAPAVAESSKTVLQLGADLDDARLAAEFGQISGRTMEAVTYEQTAGVEAWADVRFKGQSHELKVRLTRPSWEEIERQFHAAYEHAYGRLPTARAIEVVTLRVRRIGHAPAVPLPEIEPGPAMSAGAAEITLVDGTRVAAPIHTRGTLAANDAVPGPMLIEDAEATAFVPRGWTARADRHGAVHLTRP
jgi:N-methylhydantoinase A